ncbi:MAG TPA: hypothetical protein VGB45_14335, partial [Abditibacterium sp.]
MKAPFADGQWLDFYALLDVPVGADEDTLRKRIGKVYSEAAANSDHRDLARRHYFQALVERVLPQCRRVLLDPEWRAKYDRQHILHSIGDPSAQNYVAFIASMRGPVPAATEQDNLSQRWQEDIKIAREVVECAMQGAELELIPAQSVPKRDESAELSISTPLNQPNREVANPVAPIEVEAVAVAAPAPQKNVAQTTSSAPAVAKPAEVATQSPAPEVAAPISSTDAAADAAISTENEVARATVISAQEASAIRRRRSSNPDTDSFVSSPSWRSDDASLSRRRKGRKSPVSRVIVGDPNQQQTRLISPTSMNLMVAIVGVLLTISIQQFATQPAVATNVGRTPIYIAAASEMESALLRAEADFEK